jgi:hypothetical protein
MKCKNKKSKYVYIPDTPSYYHNSSLSLLIQPSSIPNAGFGVFANVDIPANTFIDYYTGYLCRGLKGGKYFFAINDDIGVNAEAYPRCYMAMLNSNANSTFLTNCKFVVDDNIEDIDNEYSKKISVWSTTDIQAGQELLIDYGKDYFF